MNTYKFIATQEDQGNRLDKFLTNKLKPLFSRSKIQNLIQAGCLASNSLIIREINHYVKSHTEYELKIPESKPHYMTASSEIKFEVVYEDEDLIVINKPSGLTVHPGAGNHQDTLVNGLLYYYRNNLSLINGMERPGIVHRLDKDTSGLMVVAKNDFTHQNLSNQLSSRSLKRVYIALTWGKPHPLIGKIDANIMRSKKDRTKMCVSKFAGKQAITNYKVLNTYLNDAISMLECKLETGRTHQIRVHLSYKGHSLIGDKLYGCVNRKIPKNNHIDISWFNRQALHSKKIGFIHPKTGNLIEFESNLPKDMQELLQTIS